MIRPVSYAEILDAPNAADLFAEYAKECLVADPTPDRSMYEQMQNAGMFYCFGAYAAGRLIGFASVIIGPMPNHGKRIASLIHIFVMPKHRVSGAGNDLLTAAENLADTERVTMVYTARVGSELEKMLMRRGVEFTHVMFTRWFRER